MIKIGIVGYGNLGKGVEAAVNNNEDMELVAVFTRRDPGSLTVKTKDVIVDSFDNIVSYKGKIDVMVNCGGSATDLPETTPAIAQHFSVIDSFDTHAKIPEHFAAVDKAAKENGNSAIISCGWDPGMFSLNRLYANAILPLGNDYTFWGRGVSQGHSDAIRRIEGVLDARQYTIPVPEALEAVRAGENPKLTTRQKHTRECFVVAADDADKAKITEEIVNMPNYFADYDTTVTFITMEEMKANHASIPHGGSVIRSGVTGLEKNTKHTIEYSLKLESNPEFTGSVIAAFSRALARRAASGVTGCFTVFDIAPAELINMTGEEIRAHML